MAAYQEGRLTSHQESDGPSVTLTSSSNQPPIIVADAGTKVQPNSSKSGGWPSRLGGD